MATGYNIDYVRQHEKRYIENGITENAYREAVAHSIGTSQNYYVLRRHGWRKIMPRSRNTKKADDEVIAELLTKSSKKEK